MRQFYLSNRRPPELLSLAPCAAAETLIAIMRISPLRRDDFIVCFALLFKIKAKGHTLETRPANPQSPQSPYRRRASAASATTRRRKERPPPRACRGRRGSPLRRAP